MAAETGSWRFWKSGLARSARLRIAHSARPANRQSWKSAKRAARPSWKTIRFFEHGINAAGCTVEVVVPTPVFLDQKPRCYTDSFLYFLETQFQSYSFFLRMFRFM